MGNSRRRFPLSQFFVLNLQKTVYHPFAACLNSVGDIE